MIVALIARSTSARTSAWARPAWSFHWVRVRTRASRMSGGGSGGIPPGLSTSGWPREAHSASYTASTARPTSERASGSRDPARTSAPTRQNAVDVIRMAARGRVPGRQPRVAVTRAGRPPATLHPAGLQLGTRSLEHRQLPVQLTQDQLRVRGRHQPLPHPAPPARSSGGAVSCRHLVRCSRLGVTRPATSCPLSLFQHYTPFCAAPRQSVAAVTPLVPSAVSCRRDRPRERVERFIASP